MRQWLGVEPSALCRRHLLGEHGELHKCVGSIKQALAGKLGHERSVRGLIERGFLDLAQFLPRHDAPAAEMLRRGYNHQSPLDATALPDWGGAIDPARSRADLADRCAECREGMGGAVMALGTLQREVLDVANQVIARYGFVTLGTIGHSLGRTYTSKLGREYATPAVERAAKRLVELGLLATKNNGMYGRVYVLPDEEAQ